MKVIAVSNFDKETVDDRLICTGITNNKIGQEVVDLLNKTYCPTGKETYYYMLVEDDRTLHKWQP